MSGDPRVPQTSGFEREAVGRRTSLLGEFWHFFIYNKKWWLLPICVVLALFGVLMLLGSTPAAPFIYTLF